MGDLLIDPELERLMSKKQWYVIQTYSGYEKSVKNALTDRIRRSGFAERFGRILVPTEEVVEVRSGQRSVTERKFFPGYVFIEMEMNDETWHLVKSAPRVSGFVGGTAMRPTPIAEAEIMKILQQMEEGGERPRPKTLFDVGESVRIKEGPFADFNGNVEDVNYEKNKLRVLVTIFGRATPVELDFGQVEKL